MEIVVDVPDGSSGDWKVETFVIEKDAPGLLYLALKGRYVAPGIYKRLVHKRRVIMSNTQAEIMDFRYFLNKAKGNVLINGLGLGVLLKALLDKPGIESVTVIEISEDVINLVGSHFKDPRVQIIHADALTWKPPKGVHYDAAWHDIWDDICLTNWESMSKLHRKYGRKCSYQDSWCRAQIMRERELEKKRIFI